MAADDEPVEVDQLLRAEPVGARGRRGSAGRGPGCCGTPLCGVVDAGLRHLPEVVVGGHDADAVPGADG